MIRYVILLVLIFLFGCKKPSAADTSSPAQSFSTSLQLNGTGSYSGSFGSGHVSKSILLYHSFSVGQLVSVTFTSDTISRGVGYLFTCDCAQGQLAANKTGSITFSHQY